MGRFLIYFSYFGTRYSGLQRQLKLVNGKPIPTIERALQNAMEKLKPANEFKITLSSRTDKGVHSLTNTCHVDLENPEEGIEYDPEVITNVVNYDLEENLHDVRVLKTRRVNPSFHARLSARERKYVYRLAHTVGNVKTLEERQEMTRQLKKFLMPRHKHHKDLERIAFPISDVGKVRIFRQALDIPKLISAAQVCSGIHDYSSFTTPPKENDSNYKPSPVKLLSIGVKRGRPFTHPLNTIGHDPTRHMEFWDIHVRARSFVYKQIRRLVGGMVLVARKDIGLDDLKDILDRPQVNFPFAGRMSLNECGLFLLDVGYDPEDLEFDESSCEIPSTDTTSDVDTKELNGDSRKTMEENVCGSGSDEKVCRTDKAEERFIQKQL